MQVIILLNYHFNVCLVHRGSSASLKILKSKLSKIKQSEFNATSSILKRKTAADCQTCMLYLLIINNIHFFKQFSVFSQFKDIKDCAVIFELFNKKLKEGYVE